MNQTVTLEINVMASNLRWDDRPDREYFVGDFIFQQVSPRDQLLVDEKGNLNLRNVDGPVEIVYRWLSPLLAIEGDLYPAGLPEETREAIWIVRGRAKPRTSEKGINDLPFTIRGAPESDAIVLINPNENGERYTYLLAIKVAIDGGQWLVADPRIINR